MRTKDEKIIRMVSLLGAVADCYPLCRTGGRGVRYGKHFFFYGRKMDKIWS